MNVEKTPPYQGQGGVPFQPHLVVGALTKGVCNLAVSSDCFHKELGRMAPGNLSSASVADDYLIETAIAPAVRKLDLGTELLPTT